MITGKENLTVSLRCFKILLQKKINTETAYRLCMFSDSLKKHLFFPFSTGIYYYLL